MNEPVRTTRLEISFGNQGQAVDRTMEMQPQEDLRRFLERCSREVTEYFRFDWKNSYRLQGEVETEWLSESSMFDLLRERTGPGKPRARRDVEGGPSPPCP